MITPQITCPVDGCTWRLVFDTAPTSLRYLVRGDLPLPEALDQAITEAANGRAKATEDAVRDHLDTHDVLDFMRTIHRLKCDLEQDVRPHVFPEEAG